MHSPSDSTAAHPEKAALVGTPPSPSRPPKPSRLRKEQAILVEAESHFARFGFAGASLEAIAIDLGISRHNLLYYFPSKDLLYQRVLVDVLQQWLEGLQNIALSAGPEEALRGYIGHKLRYSRDRPNGVKVFTKEIMSGASHDHRAILEDMAPRLSVSVQAFERWAQEGRIASVDFRHLMFALWTMTEAYATHHTPFALLLGQAELRPTDYAEAENFILRMVLGALQPMGPKEHAADCACAEHGMHPPHRQPLSTGSVVS
ncbi:MAG: TetR/AcrR family transcriptional regulator [Burkholderiaceae bacterium]|nr:TetR/AcrR family transcriptional regulator [Burkholderiaceae bacterium]